MQNGSPTRNPPITIHQKNDRSTLKILQCQPPPSHHLDICAWCDIYAYVNCTHPHSSQADVVEHSEHEDLALSAMLRGFCAHLWRQEFANARQTTLFEHGVACRGASAQRSQWIGLCGGV
jgi:hypothetical protein